MPFLESAGLREALAGLDRIARLDATRDLREIFADLTGDVVSTARGRARTPMQQEAASTLVNASSATGAAIRFGAGFPGAFGAEFGAGRNARRIVHHFGYYTGWQQFDYWKGSEGYFVWPSIRSVTTDRLGDIGDAVADVFDKAGA